MKIRWLGNSCLEISGEKNILIDPSYMKKPQIEPDIILITHEHSDHIDPDKLEEFKDYKLYAPSSVFEEHDISGETIQAGDTIENDIKVIGVDAYGTEEAVCYYYNGLYHTADASNYKDPGEEVEVLFTACFPNLYNDYLKSIRNVQPELTIPYHIDPGDKEDLEDLNGLKNFLIEHDIKTRILQMGEELEI